MGADFAKEIGFLTTYFIREFIERLDSSIKNNTDLDIKEEVEKLTSFCISDSFIPYLCCELKFKIPFIGFISLYESKEKFLSLKIMLSLSEQLKIKKIDIDNKIKIARNNSKEEKINIVAQFLDDIKNKDSYQEFINNSNKTLTLTNILVFSKFAQDYIDKNKSHIRSLYQFYIIFVRLYFMFHIYFLTLTLKFLELKILKIQKKIKNCYLKIYIPYTLVSFDHLPF